MLVREPWPTPYLLVPTCSTVEVICTAVDESKIPIWAVDLISEPGAVQFQFGSRSDDLNSHGVYELPQIETPGSGVPPTLRLLINNTAVNNQTVIYCDRRGAASTTTLFVFGKPPPPFLAVSNSDYHLL